MAKIVEIFDIPQMTPYVVKGLKAESAKEIWNIPSQEVVGIEVEAENVDHIAEGLNKVWVVKEDGSLRNHGREFITKPINASIAPAALDNLLNGCNFSFSPRTSVHVHLNCMDMTTNQVVDIVLLYALFERSFFRFVGKGRIRNIYCTPITDTGTLMQHLGTHGVKSPWEKYSGLNIIPLSQHGTLEFRHMHGTTDVKKLSIWIDLITRLKEYVKVHSTDEIRRTINGFSEASIGQVSNAIWGELAGHLQISDPDEVLSRVPVVKLAMCKTNAVNTTIRGNVSATSKYFTV